MFDITFSLIFEPRWNTITTTYYTHVLSDVQFLRSPTLNYKIKMFLF